MANVESSSVNPNIQSKLELMKKEVEDELKSVNSAIEKITGLSNDKTRELFDKVLNDLTKTVMSLNEALETIINSNQTITEHELQNLQESIDGQLSSLRSFADQLVHDEEGRLVETLEQSLHQLTSMNNSHAAKLQEFISRINTTVESTTNSPVKIVEARNQSLKVDIIKILELEREKLISSLIGLQSEFRDKISTQIEKVFMGVTMTKETLNGIIRDTLSRLEVNLSRLHSGIDDNFTKEIGTTQDMIHNYEGKMLEAIDKSKGDYELAMQGVVERNAKTLENSLTELKLELEKTKTQLQTQLHDLSEEQQNSLSSTLKNLEAQIDKSKAEVIESHGLLKDDLEKLLAKNSESISEFMSSMKDNNSTTVSDMHKQLKEKTSSMKEMSSESIKSSKKEVETLLDQLKKENHNRIDQTSKKVKTNFDSLKSEGN